MQKRKADELNSTLKARALTKKIRKPIYNYQKPIESDMKRQKMNHEHSQSKIIVDENESPNFSHNENSQDSVINVDKDDSPSETLVSPPILSANNSAFYPYVDPLHFFIDLQGVRVYDRKKEAYLSSLKNNNILENWNNPIITKNRVGSAFKIPGSCEANNNSFSAINLISNDPLSLKAKRKSDGDSESEKNEDDVEIQSYDLDQKLEDSKSENK